MYANSDVPEWKTSPSFPPLLETDTDRYVPPDSPGLLDFVANYPGIPVGGAGGPFEGVFEPPADFSGGAIFVGRPIAVTGPAEVGSREHTTYRILAGLEGEFGGGTTYTTSLTSVRLVSPKRNCSPRILRCASSSRGSPKPPQT